MRSEEERVEIASMIELSRGEGLVARDGSVAMRTTRSSTAWRSPPIRAADSCDIISGILATRNIRSEMRCVQSCTSTQLDNNF